MLSDKVIIARQNFNTVIKFILRSAELSALKYYFVKIQSASPENMIVLSTSEYMVKNIFILLLIILMPSPQHSWKPF